MTDLALKTDLWEHQKRAASFAWGRRGTYFDVWMGGGKTLTAIALAQAWQCARVLVIAPTSVVTTWPANLNRHSRLDWACSALEKGASVARRLADAERELTLAGCAPYMLVVNHESAWREPLKPWLLRQPWDLLIVDEAHRTKSAGGKLSLFLRQLTKRKPKMRRLALSGTPMPHSPLDLYAQARFLDPSVFGTRKAAFQDEFLDMDQREVYNPKKGKREVVDTGVPRLKEDRREYFQASLRRFMFRVTKEECDVDTPPVTDMDRWTVLEPEAQRVYNELASEFIADLDRGVVTAANAAVKVLRLAQVACGHIPVDGHPSMIEHVSAAREKLLADVLEDLAPRPVVVFCRFKPDLDAARRQLQHAGRKVAELSGARDDLEHGKMPAWCDALVAQIQAGGVGVDLTAADTGIFYSIGHSLGDYLQARARLDRPGQRLPVTLVHLGVRGTVDVQIRRALAAREDVVTSILEGVR